MRGQVRVIPPMRTLECNREWWVEPEMRGHVDPEGGVIQHCPSSKRTLELMRNLICEKWVGLGVWNGVVKCRPVLLL